MAHIDFNLQGWLHDNPNAKMSDLCEAIQSADEVYCGWIVEDAETIREEKYGDRADLSIKDSRIVIFNADCLADRSIGFGWEDLYNAYAAYVAYLDENPDQTRQQFHPLMKYIH